MALINQEAGAGDVGTLYASLAPRLERIVRIDVRAPDAVIEDACQFAWSRLLHHRDRVRRETALGWLARTAVHEAFRTLRRARREESLDAVLEPSGELPAASFAAAARRSAASAEECFEQREAVELVRALPERQQRILWLHALGLSYAEIAVHEGCTRRTVERQLLRAKRAVRAAAGG